MTIFKANHLNVFGMWQTHRRMYAFVCVVDVFNGWLPLNTHWTMNRHGNTGVTWSLFAAFDTPRVHSFVVYGTVVFRYNATHIHSYAASHTTHNRLQHISSTSYHPAARLRLSALLSFIWNFNDFFSFKINSNLNAIFY